MTFDFEDWDRMVKEKRKERINGQRGQLEQFQQAAVSANQLTGDPAWDIYLQHLQQAILEYEAMAEMHEVQLTLPETVNHDQIVRLKIKLAEAKGHAAGLSFALDLPKRIKEMGDKASEMLESADGITSE